jgi:signal peptidase
MRSRFIHTEIPEEKMVAKPRRKTLLESLAALVGATGLWWADVVGGGLFVVYLMVQFILPGLVSGDLYLYFWQPLLWIFLAILAGLGWRFGLRVRPAFKASLAGMGAMIAACQIALSILAGLMLGFGRSPYSHQILPILGNLLYLGSMLVGIEISRAYLIALLGRRAPLLALISLTIFFSVIALPVGIFTGISSPQSAIRVFGERVLPMLSENLLATLLAFLGGPLASMAYQGTLLGFEWLSPILPHLGWFSSALLGTLLPGFGFLLVYNQYTVESGEAGAASEKAGESMTAWAIVSLVSLLLMGFITGLFGYQPTLVASGSMTPTLLLGDVVITRPVPPEEVKVGDIIRYQDGAFDTIHRVIEIQGGSGGFTFITRGDTNDRNDPPVPENAVKGVVVFNIPKIGWVTIMLRDVIGWISG